MTRTPVYFIGPIRDQGAGVAVWGRHGEYRRIDNPPKSQQVLLLKLLLPTISYEKLDDLDVEIKYVYICDIVQYKKLTL